MKRFLPILTFILCIAATAKAQYTTSGKIEFERKTNFWGQIADYGEPDWLERVKASTPQFRSSFFDLYFDNTRSIYKPGKEQDAGNKSSWGDGPAKDNTVLTNLVAKDVKAIKQVYEQKFFVHDSMRKIDWKEKEEIRTIANYKCHKAVGRICDSVYVVAFYTEDIPAGSGPEMFGGLPGMIMELAIPRLHTTWTATKVELTTPNESDFTMSEKGKKVTEKELYETIQSSLKDWGKWASKNIWWTVL